jgi:transcriptional regulator with GAF, ATPase, and Fis domain
LPDVPSKRAVQPSPDSSVNHSVLTDAQVRILERRNMQAALDAANGKLFGKGGAAELMGMKPTTLASRLKRLDIEAG